MGIVAAVVDFLFLFFFMGFDFGTGIDCGGGGNFFFCWGNFGGDGLVFVADFWWKVDVWLYRRETEKGREERD